LLVHLIASEPSKTSSWPEPAPDRVRGSGIVPAGGAVEWADIFKPVRILRTCGAGRADKLRMMMKRRRRE